MLGRWDEIAFTPEFANRLSTAIRTLNSWGVAPQINGAYRTIEDQRQEWINRTSLGACNPDDEAKACEHPLGYSVDLNVRTVHLGPNKDLWQFNPDFPQILLAMWDQHFDWGGFFSKPDWVHFYNDPPGSLQERRDLIKRLDDYFNQRLKWPDPTLLSHPGASDVQAFDMDVHPADAR